LCVPVPLGITIDGTIYIFSYLVTNSPGGLGFTFLGTVVIRIDAPVPADPMQWNYSVSELLPLTGANQNWATAVVRMQPVDDGYLYILGKSANAVLARIRFDMAYEQSWSHTGQLCGHGSWPLAEHAILDLPSRLAKVVLRCLPYTC
jgi:hypothetical protein